MLGQNFAEKSIEVSFLKSASFYEHRGSTLVDAKNFHSSARPADNDFAQSLLFNNDSVSESGNAQTFMQKLSMMLSRDLQRSSVKRKQKENQDTIQNLNP